jgi:prolyl oligopeptidase
VTEQVWYKSKDGAKVPMFLVHAKDVTLDGERPTYLTGYGGFRSSKHSWFNRERGAVGRARRHLRGAEPARRRRVRRGLAQGRHAGQEAERSSTTSPARPSG